MDVLKVVMAMIVAAEDQQEVFYASLEDIRLYTMPATPPKSTGSEPTPKRLESLARIYELTAELLHPEEVDTLLRRICESISELFGFDLIGISILDPKKTLFLLRACAGYSKEEEKELIASEGLFEKDEVMKDFIEANRLSKIAYYVPYEKQTSSLDKFVLVRDPEAAQKGRASPELWHELDLLYFALYDRKGDMTGFLQVDYPRDGKIPPGQTIEEIELFATLAAVAIENSNMFMQMQDLLHENEVKTARILRLLELMRSVLRVDDLDTVLQKVSDTMSATFGFRKTGVSMFTRGSNRVTAHALTGYTKDEETKVRNSPIYRDVVLSDFKEEFRVTRTGYYIPGEMQGNGSTFVFMESPDGAKKPRASPESWHELDLLYFAMHDRNGNMLGFIQLDYPVDNKIPKKETMESMEAFASIATIAIENSKMFETLEDTKDQVSMYLDILTHDVGNLVNPISAYLEIVMATTQLNQSQYKYLASAQEAVKGIIHVVRNVRRSAQMLETTGVELVPMNLTKSIREISQESKSAFLSRNVQIKHEVPAQDIWVMADSLLDEVIYNVLTNAIKYDEHEGVIVDISAKPVEFEGKKFAEVRIADRGIGIQDELKDKVFTREFKKLVKADRLSLQRSRGAGMGLSLVKSLVERYGGSVWVENRVPDDHTRGSVFVIMLPRP